jgi:hypothetical protein
MLFYRAALLLSQFDLPVRRPAPPQPRDRLVLAQAEPGQQALLVLVHLREGETLE